VSEEKEQKRHSRIKEYTEALITALVIAMIIRAFLIQPFKIPSGSMIPTLLIGDQIMVEKISLGTIVDIPFTRIELFRMPGLRKPKRNDIIVFRYPMDRSRDFIKRVIATEGDIVEERNKTVYVNGQPLNEPYVQHVDSRILRDRRDQFGPVRVPEGKLFVMGDNRDQSADSRYWGFVDIKDIRGRAFIIHWSWDSEKHWIRFNRIGRLLQ